jgi:uncharacterized protein (DUF2147 family)
MKKHIFLVIAFVFTTVLVTNAQSIFGKWKTIDDKTSIVKSIVEIYNINGKAYAKVLRILEKGKEDELCDKCKGAKKDKPIKGMEIINGLSKDDGEWNGGKILDPKVGKEYKCYITLETPNKLKVRGYIGFALFGRTQYWYRVEE